MQCGIFQGDSCAFILSEAVQDDLPVNMVYVPENNSFYEHCCLNVKSCNSTI